MMANVLRNGQIITIPDYEIPEPILNLVPEKITKAQFRIALKRANRLNAVKTYMQTLGASDDARILLEDSAIIYRDGETVAALKSGLGVTDEQIDNLFIQAAAIKE